MGQKFKYINYFVTIILYVTDILVSIVTEYKTMKGVRGVNDTKFD